MFALKPLNAFNIAFQSSSSKIGTLQEDVRNLLRGFLSNFIRPELLAATSNKDIYSFDFDNQLSNDELGIGSATRLLLIESSDVLEGTREEEKFFRSVRGFYTDCCPVDCNYCPENCDCCRKFPPPSPAKLPMLVISTDSIQRESDWSCPLEPVLLHLGSLLPLCKDL